MRLACIDVGSNTTRLLVAEAVPGGIRDIRNERAFTLIGRSLDRGRRIPPEKVEQTAATVAAQAEIARGLGAETVRAVATAAIRSASNAAELADAIERRAAVELEVLAAGDEARLAHRGASHVMGGAGTLAVVDVGGGSTEIAIGEAGGRLSYAESVPIGSSTLAERHLATDPPLREHIDNARAEAKRALAALWPPPVERAVAVGGSASSLQLLAGPELDPPALAAALSVLLAGASPDVAARFELDPERVRLLPAGLVVLERVGQLLGCPLRICKGGLREGVILEMIERSR